MPRTRRPQTNQNRSSRTAAALLTAAVILGTTASACSDDPALDPGPPAPAQIATETSPPTPIPSSTTAQISFDEPAERLVDDPVVKAFQEYVFALGPVLRDPDASPDSLLELITGAAAEDILGQIERYRQNDWVLAGASIRIVTDLHVVDDVRRAVISCEYDMAAYPVNQDGEPATEVGDRWLPDEHWFIFSDGRWKLEQLYRGTHDCDKFYEPS